MPRGHRGNERYDQCWESHGNQDSGWHECDRFAQAQPQDRNAGRHVNQDRWQSGWQEQNLAWPSSSMSFARREPRGPTEAEHREPVLHG